AMYGVDSPTCGTKAAPCRSLSQAIANASPGDTILAGPGFYGDLNGNHSYADPGDEVAEIGTGCDCIVNVNKAVTLKSRDGANVTVIRGPEAGAVLHVSASGATIGGTQNGFTLRDAMHHGFRVEAEANGVRVLGNVADSNGSNGFEIEGEDAVVTGNRAVLN